MRPVLALTFASLLNSCAAVSDRPPPPFELIADIQEATRFFGSPMTAAQVQADWEQLVGRTVLVEGFLGSLCDEDSAADCVHSADRFVISSNEALPPAPGPLRQPCPWSKQGNGMDIVVLVGGYLPTGYSRLTNQRALVQGVVSKRTVSVPIPMRAAPGMRIEFVYDFVLDGASVLALYDSRCRGLN